MHSMKYVQRKLFLSDCAKAATSSCFSFYTLVANKGIPANSHVLCVSLTNQGQSLLPNSQIWTNCSLTHDKGPFIIYGLMGLGFFFLGSRKKYLTSFSLNIFFSPPDDEIFFPAPNPHKSLWTKVKYHNSPSLSL